MPHITKVLEENQEAATFRDMLRRLESEHDGQRNPVIRGFTFPDLSQTLAIYDIPVQAFVHWEFLPFIDDIAEQVKKAAETKDAEGVIYGLHCYKLLQATGETLQMLLDYLRMVEYRDDASEWEARVRYTLRELERVGDALQQTFAPGITPERLWQHPWLPLETIPEDLRAYALQIATNPIFDREKQETAEWHQRMASMEAREINSAPKDVPGRVSQHRKLRASTLQFDNAYAMQLAECRLSPEEMQYFFFTASEALAHVERVGDVIGFHPEQATGDTIRKPSLQTLSDKAEQAVQMLENAFGYYCDGMRRQLRDIAENNQILLLRPDHKGRHDAPASSVPLVPMEGNSGAVMTFAFFNGSHESIFNLAHELGHEWHNRKSLELIRHNEAHPYAWMGDNMTAEFFSLSAEMIVATYILTHPQDPLVSADKITPDAIALRLFQADYLNIFYGLLKADFAMRMDLSHSTAEAVEATLKTFHIPEDIQENVSYFVRYSYASNSHNPYMAVNYTLARAASRGIFALCEEITASLPEDAANSLRHALGEAILREARSHTGKSVRDVAENVAQELAPYLSPEQISFSALCGKGI
ncbi:MAG: hypothetical protein J0L97_05645, partial [Alphaproteobacteria bacterium]|nr:hypothetical protein [Alphaproteobacteria bacterium]